jgi:DNA-binding CsgD family transcriptional regulator
MPQAAGMPLAIADLRQLANKSNDAWTARLTPASTLIFTGNWLFLRPGPEQFIVVPRVAPPTCRKLSQALLELHREATLASLPDVFFCALRQLIAADIYTVDIVDFQRSCGRYRTWPANIPGADTAVLDAHMREHPSFGTISRPWERPVAMWSDFTTLRQFRQKGLYHEFYRCSGTNYQIVLAFPADNEATVCIVFNRRLRNFTEDDRALLHILEPHLADAYRKAKSRTEMERALALKNLTEGEDALLVATESGECAFATKQAERLCQEWFGEFAEGELPADIRQWLETNPSPRANLIRNKGQRRLEVKCSTPAALIQPAGFLVNTDPLCLARVIRFQERPAEPSAEVLQSLGLTPREAEVLAWIAQGKRNSEIAVILGNQTRTVGKHVENVLGKLRAETRSAAAALAWECLSR